MCKITLENIYTNAVSGVSDKYQVCLLSVGMLSKESILYGGGIIVTIKMEVNIFMDFFMAHFNCIQLFLMSCLASQEISLVHIVTLQVVVSLAVRYCEAKKFKLLLITL